MEGDINLLVLLNAHATSQSQMTNKNMQPTELYSLKHAQCESMIAYALDG